MDDGTLAEFLDSNLSSIGGELNEIWRELSNFVAKGVQQHLDHLGKLLGEV